MKFILFLFLSVFLQNIPPHHLRAYAVSAEGKNILADPLLGNYKACDVDVQFQGKICKLGKELFTIYRREKLMDSIVTYFGYSVCARDTFYSSITVAPGNVIKEWLIMIAYADSTKAYKAKAL